MCYLARSRSCVDQAGLCCAGDSCTGAYAPGGAERNDASPCFAVTPEDARNIRLKHFVAYVQGAATNATTGISTWPPAVEDQPQWKTDDISRGDDALQASRQQPGPGGILWDNTQLQRMRGSQNETQGEKAVAALLKSAQRQLNAGPFSVM